MKVSSSRTVNPKLQCLKIVHFRKLQNIIFCNIFFQTFALVLAFAAAVLADNPPPPPQPYSPPAPAPSYSQPSYPDQPAQYQFEWQVKDDYSQNDYGQQEERDGKNAQGSYYVALPDGRLQKIAYRVDGYSGFVADITYEGEAQYPEETASSYQRPSYQPAPPKPSYPAPAPAPKYPPPPPPPSYPAPAPEPSYPAPAPAPEPSYPPPSPPPSYAPAPEPTPGPVSIKLIQKHR